MRAAALLVLVMTLGAGAAGVLAKEPGPLDCPVKALLFEDDEGLRRQVYDGIRAGLEQAKLPRVCREDAASDEEVEAVLRRLEAEPPPLLFVLGRRSAERLGARLADVPRVFVDLAWDVNGAPLPADPEPRAPAAVVRSVVSAVNMAELLRGLGLARKRPRARLTWTDASAEVEAPELRLGAAAGFVPCKKGEKPEVLLHMRLHGNEKAPALSRLLELAERERIPLVSDDLAHWGRGASVVLLPDLFLLGRVAAEEGRRLLSRDEGDETVPQRRVRAYEIRLDLRAAARQGFEPPLAFIARADRLRRGPRRPRRRP